MQTFQQLIDYVINVKWRDVQYTYMHWCAYTLFTWTYCVSAFWLGLLLICLLGRLIAWLLVWNYVCMCVYVCVHACVFAPSLSPIFPPYSSFLLCLWTLADDYLVYYKHYHNIAVSCTKTGIKHDHKNNNLTLLSVLKFLNKKMQTHFITRVDSCKWHNQASHHIIIIIINNSYNALFSYRTVLKLPVNVCSVWLLTSAAAPSPLLCFRKVWHWVIF